MPLLSLLLLAPLFLGAYYLTSPAEDAVILYEYSRNLAEHAIVTYGGATTPIEGATDFLWMILIGLGKLVGVDEFLCALALNLAAAIYLVNAVDAPKVKIIAFAGLLATPFLYASLDGFSALFFSAVFVHAASLALLNRRSFYLAVLALCLVRPDGVVWGAGLLLLKVTEHRAAIDPRAELKTALAFLVLPGSIYFFARAWYFSEWLPLPFLVKASGQRDLLLFYRDSLRDIATVALPVVLGAIASGRARVIRRVGLVFVLPILFYGALRLEQNIGNRFLAPMFFGTLFFIGSERAYRALLVFLAAAIYLGLPATKETVINVVNSRTENILHLSRDLARLHGRMLTTEAGRLAYYSHWNVEDSWGLNTPRFAHRVISAEALAQEAPYDLIVGHCNFALLDPGADLQPVGGRSWVNQCKALVAEIRRRDYEVFLVPHLRADDSLPLERMKIYLRGGRKAVPAVCERYDIYGIDRAYPERAALRQILLDGHALPYATDLKKKDGDQICHS